MKLLTTEIVHLLLSTLIGLFFWSTSGIWGLVGAIFAGFLVDSDHMIDYLIYLKNWRKFSIKQFISSEQFVKSNKLYIFFHSWEYGLIFLTLSITLNFPILTTISISYLTHLTIDQLTNDVRPFTYFILARAKHGFVNQCKS